MTLKQLYSDPEKRKHIIWWKAALKLIELSARNQSELVYTHNIIKRYKLLCRQCSIESSLSLCYSQLLVSEQKFVDMLLVNIDRLVKRG